MIRYLCKTFYTNSTYKLIYFKFYNFDGVEFKKDKYVIQTG